MLATLTPRMSSWLIGIGIAGFFVSLWLAFAMRPGGARSRADAEAQRRWWFGSLEIAVVGAALATLFAWPAWVLGDFLGPHFDVSARIGAVAFACIFGLGGAALTGVGHVALAERLEKGTDDS